MKKKLVSIVLAAVLSAAALTGCGEAAEDNASSVSSAQSAAVSSEAASSDSSEAVSSETAASEAASADSSALSDASSEAASSDAAGTSEPVDIRVAALKGPTAMGLVKFMDEADNGELTDNNYSFQILDAPDELSPMVVKGDVDIATVPGNLASVLYNKTEGAVEVFAVNTLGVLYIVDNGTPVDSVADLKGRSLVASGMGSTPQYALNYILKNNGLDPDSDVDITWVDDHSMALETLMKGTADLAMLPQPFVTVAQTKSDTIHVDLDLTKEWDKIQENSDTPSSLIMGVAIVRKDFAEQHPEAVAAFMEHYADSVNYVNSNVEDAAALVGKYDIVAEAVAAKAIPYCNITYIDGEEMKAGLSGFLQVLYDADPSAVGGTLPGDDFYYEK